MGFRFFILDDAAFFRELLRFNLEKLGGIYVGEADRGTTAAQLVGETKPDFLFLDLVLPDHNGLDCVSAVRLRSPQTKIIACSSLSIQELTSLRVLQNVDGYLPKPFGMEELKRALEIGNFRKEEIAG